MLESLGWRIHRIWSTEWFRSKDREVARTLERIQAELANIEPLHTKTTVDQIYLEEMLSSESEDDQDISFSQFDYRSHPYLDATLTVPTYTDLLLTLRSTVVDAVEECVQQEWPVHTDLVIQRVARHWGNARTGNRIRAYVSEAIHSAIKQKRVTRRGDFLWKPGEDSLIVRGKSREGRVREIEHVASEEIAEAFQEVLRIGFDVGDGLVARDCQETWV